MFGILSRSTRDASRLMERVFERLCQDLAQDGGRATLPPQYLDPRFLTGASFKSFVAKYPGAKEIVREPIYHLKPYATGGYTQRTFLDETFGSATNGWGDTNIQVANQPCQAGEAFLATNVRVLPIPAQADYDTAAAGTPVAFGQWNEILWRNCWAEFWYLQKPWFRAGPLALFPSGIGPGTVVGGAATVLRNVSWPNNGQPDVKSLFVLDPPLLIQPLDNVAFYMNWKTALVSTTAGKLGVIIDGYRVRNVQ